MVACFNLVPVHLIPTSSSMKIDDLREVVWKLVAVGFLFLGCAQLIVAILLGFYYGSWQVFLGRGTPTALWLGMAGMSLSVSVRYGRAAVAAGRDGARLGVEQALALGITVMGLWFVVDSLPSLAQWSVDQLFDSASEDLTLRHQLAREFVLIATRFVLGVLMVACSREIVQVWTRLTGRGGMQP